MMGIGGWAIVWPNVLKSHVTLPELLWPRGMNSIDCISLAPLLSVSSWVQSVEGMTRKAEAGEGVLLSEPLTVSLTAVYSSWTLYDLSFWWSLLHGCYPHKVILFKPLESWRAQCLFKPSVITFSPSSMVLSVSTSE